MAYIRKQKVKKNKTRGAEFEGQNASSINLNNLNVGGKSLFVKDPKDKKKVELP